MFRPVDQIIDDAVNHSRPNVMDTLTESNRMQAHNGLDWNKAEVDHIAEQMNTLSRVADDVFWLCSVLGSGVGCASVRPANGAPIVGGALRMCCTMEYCRTESCWDSERGLCYASTNCCCCRGVANFPPKSATGVYGGHPLCGCCDIRLGAPSKKENATFALEGTDRQAVTDGFLLSYCCCAGVVLKNPWVAPILGGNEKCFCCEHESRCAPFSMCWILGKCFCPVLALNNCACNDPLAPEVPFLACFGLECVPYYGIQDDENTADLEVPMQEVME